MDKTNIRSLKELQSLMPQILQQYGSNYELTTLALSNPIMALEKAGFHFTENAKNEIETHIRFGKKGAAQYNQLKISIEKEIGEPFVPSNKERMAEIITKLIKKEASSKAIAKKSAVSIDKETVLNFLKPEPEIRGDKIIDRLSEIEHLHPVISSFITYRRMEIEHQAFSDSGNISAVEKIIAKSPLKTIVFRLKRNGDN